MPKRISTRADTVARPVPSSPPAKVEHLDDSLGITEYGSPQIVGLRATGGIDLRSHIAWDHALRRAVGHGEEVHLDLTGLEFIDSRGAAALVEAANHLTGGHQIVVHHAPPYFQRIMQVLWPEGVPSIVIERAAR
ncbi:STAS domain-containing protein [Glycomyces luteolus]|uniref:STAS domain-containing protein n=1 Tax=Glycomyces luteolus TaxID=2670330 RepID=A0A9X3PDC4_9ACTN|nr:STAS domain-containing protein [Glycomyces luteolus]MDA1362694.1 STAS domain-containing protein [Glycomyces luteolus]